MGLIPFISLNTRSDSRFCDDHAPPPKMLSVLGVNLTPLEDMRFILKPGFTQESPSIVDILPKQVKHSYPLFFISLDQLVHDLDQVFIKFVIFNQRSSKRKYRNSTLLAPPLKDLFGIWPTDTWTIIFRFLDCHENQNNVLNYVEIELPSLSCINNLERQFCNALPQNIFYSIIQRWNFLYVVKYIIIIIIMSRRLRGYPWPSLAISPYHSSPPAGLQDYNPCPHIAAVCKFVLVVPHLHIHEWGSTGVHRLWARPCFSSSVPRVWFVELV